MARHAAKSTSQSVDSTIGNFEGVRTAELIEDHLAHAKVSEQEFIWWSNLASKLLREALSDE